MNKLDGDKGELFKNLLDQLKQEDSVIRVQLNDQRLMKLAEYDATHGYMNMKVTPDQFQARFYELKGLVKKGSFTLKTLEDDVYNRWGINEEQRDEVLQKERKGEDVPMIITGFNVSDIKVADLKEDSPENH